MDETAAVDHWLSQGGQTTDEMRGHIAMREHARAPMPEVSFRDDEVWSAAEQAVHERAGHEAVEDSWQKARPHLDYMSEAHGMDFATMAEHGLALIELSERDPAAAEEYVSRTYSKTMFHPRVAAKPTPEEPPDYLTEAGKAEWHLYNDARTAVHSSGRDKADREELLKSAKAIARVREKLGLGPDEYTEKYRAFVSAAIDNPSGMGRRLGLAFGRPATELQAQEQRQAAEAEAYYRAQNQEALNAQEQQRAAQYQERVQWIDQRYQQWKDQQYQQGTLSPTTYETEIEPLICQVLEVMPKTGNLDQDFANAYNKAQELAHEKRKLLNEFVVQKAKRASRSINGSPSPGASRRPDYSGPYTGDDVWEDTRSAMGNI